VQLPLTRSKIENKHPYSAKIHCPVPFIPNKKTNKTRENERKQLSMAKELKSSTKG